MSTSWRGRCRRTSGTPGRRSTGGKLRYLPWHTTSRCVSCKVQRGLTTGHSSYSALFVWVLGNCWLSECFRERESGVKDSLALFLSLFGSRLSSSFRAPAGNLDLISRVSVLFGVSCDVTQMLGRLYSIWTLADSALLLFVMGNSLTSVFSKLRKYKL